MKVPTSRLPVLLGWVAFAFALVTALAGCAAGGVGAGAITPSKDIVTASDETDASKRARVRLELAEAYFGRGQMTTALDQVKLALAADPDNGPAFNLRGLIYANLGDEPLAEESFRRALQINPRDTDTMQNYGYYMCRKKRYDEADAMFMKALAIPNQNGMSRTLLAHGVCQAFAGKLEAAQATLHHAFEVDPKNPAVAVNLSEVLYRRGAFERARFYIRRVNAQPELVSAQTLWLAAKIEHGIGNPRGSQDFGDRLVSRFHDSPEAAKFHRGSFND
ncbi:MAG: type IV pilus biogenesis/stability protein PilW [Burkholderiaceae bacterium]